MIMKIAHKRKIEKQHKRINSASSGNYGYHQSFELNAVNRSVRKQWRSSRLGPQLWTQHGNLKRCQRKSMYIYYTELISCQLKAEAVKSETAQFRKDSVSWN